MTERTSRPWLNYLLGVACAGAIVAAFLVVGPASGSQATVTRTATAAQGVVQSTVSGSGNLQAASQLDLGFKTSGTVTNIYVTQGQQVTEGQLLATLDPQSAEVTLEQSKAALQSAEADLAKEEETDGETSTGQGSGGSGAGQRERRLGGIGARRGRPGDRHRRRRPTHADAIRRPRRATLAPHHHTRPTTPAATTPTATTPTTTPTASRRARRPRRPHHDHDAGQSTTSAREREPKATTKETRGSSTKRHPARPRRAPASARPRAKRTSPPPERPSRATS